MRSVSVLATSWPVVISWVLMVSLWLTSEDTSSALRSDSCSVTLSPTSANLPDSLLRRVETLSAVDCRLVTNSSPRLETLSVSDRPAASKAMASSSALEPKVRVTVRPVSSMRLVSRSPAVRSSSAKFSWAPEMA